MRRASAAAVVVVLIGTALARAAAAAPAPAEDAPSVRLEWTAPAECIDGDALAAAVSGQLGRPAFAPDADAELVARGRVEISSDSGRHRAEVVLSTRGGEPLGVRALDSDNNDCHSLDEALAVMLAIMLNVRRADVPALARETPPPPAPRWRPRAGAGAGVVLGLLPEPGIEAVVSAGVMRGGRLEPGVDFAWDWAGEAPAAEGRIRVQAASARLVIAPVIAELGRARVDVRLRLSAGAGPMWASASGFAQVFSQTRLVADGRVGVQLGVRVAGPVWIQIGGEVGWLPIRPSFEVRNPDGTVETLFQPQPVMGIVAAGLALRAR